MGIYMLLDKCEVMLLHSSGSDETNDLDVWCALEGAKLSPYLDKHGEASHGLQYVVDCLCFGDWCLIWVQICRRLLPFLGNWYQIWVEICRLLLPFPGF
jgi:hypothetical protein